MKAPLYITSFNENGQALVGGVARMWFQHGFPVDMSFEIIKEDRNKVDWCEALADAWLNDPSKFDVIVNDISMLEGGDVAIQCSDNFKELGAFILASNPELKKCEFPVDEACNVILEMKRKGAGL